MDAQARLHLTAPLDCSTNRSPTLRPTVGLHIESATVLGNPATYTAVPLGTPVAQGISVRCESRRTERVPQPCRYQRPIKLASPSRTLGFSKWQPKDSESRRPTLVATTFSPSARKPSFSARSAARERKAERSALRTVLRISMSIAAKRLPQADHPKNPGKNCGRFDSAPSSCGGQAGRNRRGHA